MLRRVALVRTDFWEELSASIIRVTRIGELGTTLAETSNRRTLLTRATRRNILEAAILYLTVVRIVIVGSNVTVFYYVRA
jgi:hypothetical protein